MRVLLTGATGNVGSRLLPSLVAHKHEVVLYVRNPSKLSTEARSCAQAVVSGSGTDSDAIKNAILSNNCDAVVNAAGLAPMIGNKGELPTIFAAAMKGAIDAGKERGGRPIRMWFMAGQGIMESPKKPYLMSD